MSGTARKVEMIGTAGKVEMIGTARKVEMRGLFKEHIKDLKGFKIVFICDDSTSMLKLVDYGKDKRRWDETKETLADLLFFISQDPLVGKMSLESKVMFLNNQKGRSDFQIQAKANFQNQIKEQIEKQFSIEPLGQTLLKSCFEKATKSKKPEEKVLVIILTDGSPSENPKEEADAIKNLKTALENKDANTHVSIVSCDNDPATMKYLNDWDNNIANLDVLFDFQSEKKQILEANDGKYDFKYDDYIGKVLLGSIVPELDSLDGCYLRE